MARVGGVSLGDGVCYGCHGPDSSSRFGDLTGFEDSAHAKVDDPPSGSRVKCMTCHENHASRNTQMTRYQGYMECVRCHSPSSDGPEQSDIWTRLGNADPSSRHPLMQQDQASGARMTCQNCHNSHAVTAENPVVDPHNPSPTGTWKGSMPSSSADYCFRCHDGKPLPTGTETAPWATAVSGRGGATTLEDIKSAYDSNVHGFTTASEPATATAHLSAEMGYAVGDALDCGVCHDPHGSSNAFALRDRLTSASGDTTVSAVLVVPAPAGATTPTSTGGYDLRFFCSACHTWDPAEHDLLATGDSSAGLTATFPTDCTSCHRHVGASGSGGVGL